MSELRDVVVTCPECRAETYTGFRMDRASFESSRDEGNICYCPNGHEVEWSTPDARLTP